jgi:hypothetical protein
MHPLEGARARTIAPMEPTAAPASSSPSHDLRTRPATPEERAVIRVHAGLAVPVVVGLVSAGGAVVAFYEAGAVGRWLGRLVAGDAGAAWGLSIGRGVGAVAGALVLAVMLYAVLRLRAPAIADARAGLVEELRVRWPRAVQVSGGTRAPALALDVGFRKVLVVQGEWLRKQHVHGGPPARPEDFPSTAFTLVRLPRAGVVVRIRLEGEPVAPGPAVEALRPRYRLRDSELVEGTLEELPNALARADAERRRRSALR